jgi:hypothetical protein
MLNIFFILFLAIWFLASILGQVNAVSQKKARFRWLRRYDWFGLVPTWTFFAPNPATSDHHLLFRDRLADGTVTPWTELVAIEERKWWHAVWNPRKRQRKLLTDIISMLLVRLGRELKGKNIQRRRKKRFVVIRRRWHMEWPYLFLLNYVSSLERHHSVTDTQFGIFRSKSAIVNADAVEIALISALHRFHSLATTGDQDAGAPKLLERQA